METFSLIQINHIQNIQIDRKRKGEIVNRYLFEVLCFIEKNGKKEYGIREISDAIQISGNTVSKSLQEAKISGYIEGKQMLSITSKGIEALEPYRVKKAVIMAAGFGARMMPATADRPKPMVTVNGKRIIDTLLDALVNVGIKDIVIIRGYKKERFNEILEKYPFVRFIDNDRYDKENNISTFETLIKNNHKVSNEVFSLYKNFTQEDLDKAPRLDDIKSDFTEYNRRNKKYFKGRFTCGRYRRKDYCQYFPVRR